MAVKGNTYKFSHNGRDYEVPALSAIPTGVIRKTRKLTDDTDKSFTILEMMLGEDSKELKALDQMSPAEFGEWLNGWTQGTPLGEA